MKISRRHILKIGSVSAIFTTISGFAKSVFAEWPSSFETTAYDEAYAYVMNGQEPKEGNITIDAPEIASNGATVPVTISTDLENVKSYEQSLSKGETTAWVFVGIL